MATARRAAISALLIVGLAWALPAGAEDDEHVTMIGTVKIEHAWARATRGPDGQVFLVMHNEGDADRLVAATTAVARSVEIHGFALVSGKPGSKILGPVAVAAGKEFALEPGGVFLKLVGLKQRLVKGEEIALALTFEKAGKGEVHVLIEAADAKRHSHAGHAH